METIKNDASTWGVEAAKINRNFSQLSSPLFHFVGMAIQPIMQTGKSYYRDYLVVNANYRACIFDAFSNASYTIVGTYNVNVPSIQYLDRFLKLISTEQKTGNTATVTTPEGTRYVVVNVYNSDVTVTCNTAGSIDPNILDSYKYSDKLPATYDLAISNNCRNNGSSAITALSRLDTFGNVQTATDQYVTPFIYVPEGKTLNYKVNVLYTSRYMAIYDKYKKFKALITPSATGFMESTIQGECYVRFTVDMKYGISMWFNEETEMSTLKIALNPASVALANSNLSYTPQVNICNIHSASATADSNITNGMTIIYSGAQGSNGAAMVTGFIPIFIGNYEIRYNSVGTFGVCLYDKYKRYISGWDCGTYKIAGWTNNGGDFSITNPNVCYIRICSYKDTPIEMYPKADTNQVKPRNYFLPYYGKKLVSYGDSISAGKEWQGYLVELTGMIWDKVENDLGKGTHYELPDGTRLNAFQEGALLVPNSPTAIAGTGTRSVYITSQDMTNPIWQSNYKRCSVAARVRDAKYYSPDVIIIWTGANDHGIVDVSTVFGSIADAPYVGEDVLKATMSEPGAPTVYASFLGMLQTLCTDNPNAKIICMSLAPWRFDSEATAANYDVIQKKVNTMIRECSAKYRCEYVDLYNDLGWNHYNNSTNYGVPTDNREVHPNNVGQMKIVERLARIFR